MLVLKIVSLFLVCLYTPLFFSRWYRGDELVIGHFLGLAIGWTGFITFQWLV